MSNGKKRSRFHYALYVWVDGEYIRTTPHGMSRPALVEAFKGHMKELTGWGRAWKIRRVA